MTHLPLTRVSLVRTPGATEAFFGSGPPRVRRFCFFPDTPHIIYNLSLGAFGLVSEHYFSTGSPAEEVSRRLVI